jgi:hypothetical protein
VPICMAIVMVTLVFLLLARVVDWQIFGIANLGVMIVTAIAWHLALKRESPHTDGFKPTTLTDSRNRDRAKYIRVVVASVWLVVSLWLTRGGPWFPRLAGASVLVLFLIATITRKRTET